MLGFKAQGFGSKFGSACLQPNLTLKYPKDPNTPIEIQFINFRAQCSHFLDVEPRFKPQTL